MTEYRTSSGRVLTDEDIQALADEAERGYDIGPLLAKKEIVVELEANNPPELMESTTPPGIWLRVKDPAREGWWPVVEVRGPRDRVIAYVREQWGDEDYSPPEEKS